MRHSRPHGMHSLFERRQHTASPMTVSPSDRSVTAFPSTPPIAARALRQPFLRPAKAPAPVEEAATADLCFVLPLGHRVERVVRVLQAIDEQTEAHRVEVLAIGPDEIVAGTTLACLKNCGRVGFIKSDYGRMTGRSLAAAFGEANAPYIAVLDWFTTPSRDFAEQVLKETSVEWDGLALRQLNGNPDAGASWAAMLPETMAVHCAPTGEISRIPTIENAVWRRSALLALGEDLPALIDNGNLTDAIIEGGGVLFRNREVQVATLNPSRISVVARIRFSKGRLDAARQARTQQMNAFTRLAAALKNTALPVHRYYRHKSRLFGGRDVTPLPRRHRAIVLLGFIFESYGRATGFLFGQGKSRQRLEAMSRNRFIGMTREDQKRFGLVTANSAT